MKKVLKTFNVLLVLLLFLSCQGQQRVLKSSGSDTDSIKSSGKIAVAAAGDNENSEISSVSGRAPYFLIFDENGVFLKAIENPALNYGGGASAEVVKLLKKESCKIFIAGKFGFKMKSQLDANKIEYHVERGIAMSVVQKF